MTDIRQIAREEAERAVAHHEDICASRYANLETIMTTLKSDIGTVWKVIAWGGTTAFGMIMVVLATLAKGQWDSINELQRASQRASAQRAELQETLEQAPPPQIIIQRAQSGPEIGATIERHRR